MFEASLKARRFEKGQTIEGTIVGDRPGGRVRQRRRQRRGDDRSRRAEGRRRRPRGRGRRSHPGDGGLDRRRADALAQAGARAPRPRGSSKTRSAPGCRWKARSKRAVKGGYEVRIARQRAFCPFSQIDIRPDTDPAAHEGRVYAVPDHRVQGRRQEHRRLAARAARRGAAGAAPPRSGDRSSPARC